MENEIVLREKEDLDRIMQSIFTQTLSGPLAIRTEPTSITKIATRMPSGPLWRKLRDEGITKTEYSPSVDLEGAMYVVIPGSDVAYVATKAQVYWENPMEIDVLAIRNMQRRNLSELEEEFEIAKLDFIGSRKAIPDLELPAIRGELKTLRDWTSKYIVPTAKEVGKVAGTVAIATLVAPFVLVGTLFALIDPNITLYAGNGKIEINQVQGIPEFYVRNCRVKYNK